MATIDEPKFKVGDKIQYKDSRDSAQSGSYDTVLYIGQSRYFLRSTTGWEHSRGIDSTHEDCELVPEAWVVGVRYVRVTGGPVIKVMAVAPDGSCLARSGGADSLWALEAERREMFRVAL